MLAIIALGCVSDSALCRTDDIEESRVAAAGSIGAKLSGYADKAQGRATSKGKESSSISPFLVSISKIPVGNPKAEKRRAKIQSGVYKGRGGNHLTPRIYPAQPRRARFFQEQVLSVKGFPCGELARNLN